MTQNKHLKLKPGLVAFYHLQPVNGALCSSRAQMELLHKYNQAYDVW